MCVQAKYNCYCGNSYGKYGLSVDADCDLICHDPDYLCGGWNENSITKVDGKHCMSTDAYWSILFGQTITYWAFGKGR